MAVILDPDDNCLFVNGTDNSLKYPIERKVNHSLMVFLITIFGILLLLQLSELKCKKFKNSKKYIFSITVSLVILPIAFSGFLICKVYQMIVILILHVKLKSKFGGLLDGPDVVWTIKDDSKSIINILMIVEYKNGPSNFFNTVKDTIYQHFFIDRQRFPKALSTLHTFLGYSYLIQNDVTIEECVTKLRKHPVKTVLEKEDLVALINEHCNEDLPKHHTALWEILVGEQVVHWTKTAQTYYPVMFKVHHSLADGVSLLEVLVKILSNTPPTDLMPLKKTLIQRLKGLWEDLYLFFLIPNVIKVSDDHNVLHSARLSGSKGLVLITEESRKLLNVTKDIKKSFIGTSFSDVLIAAVSGSLRRHFEKYSKMPNCVTAVVPVVMDYVYDYRKGLLNLSNRLSVATLDVPIRLSHNDNFIGILDAIRKNTEALRHSVEFSVNLWLLRIVCSLLPEPLLRPLLTACGSTLVISILPGPSKVRVFGNHSLEDIVFWVPHRGTTGLGVSILSYDNRFQIGLSYDRTLIVDQTDAQELIEGICERLTLMHGETRKFV